MADCLALFSDYFFLEDVSRCTDSALRDRCHRDREHRDNQRIHHQVSVCVCVCVECWLTVGVHHTTLFLVLHSSIGWKSTLDIGPSPSSPSPQEWPSIGQTRPEQFAPPPSKLIWKCTRYMVTYVCAAPSPPSGWTIQWRLGLEFPQAAINFHKNK